MSTATNAEPKVVVESPLIRSVISLLDEKLFCTKNGNYLPAKMVLRQVIRKEFKTKDDFYQQKPASEAVSYVFQCECCNETSDDLNYILQHFIIPRQGPRFDYL